MFYKLGDIVRIRPDIEERRAKSDHFHMVNKIAEDGEICYDPAECWLPRTMMDDLKKIGLSTAFEIVEIYSPRSYVLRPIEPDEEEPRDLILWHFVDEMLFGPWCPAWFGEPIITKDVAISDDDLVALLSGKGGN